MSSIVDVIVACLTGLSVGVSEHSDGTLRGTVLGGGVHEPSGVTGVADLTVLTI